MTENNIQNRIDTIFTQSGANQVVSAVDKLETKTKSTGAEAKKAADVFALWERTAKNLERTASLDKVRSGLIKAARSGKDMTAAFAEADKQLKTLNATAAETQNVVSSAAVAAAEGPAGGRAAFFREARLAAPAIPIPGTGVSSESVFRGGEILSRLGIGLKEIAIGGPVAVAAIAGLSIALQNFKDTVEPVAGLLTGLTKGKADLAELLATGTPEEIVAEIKRRNEDLKGEKARLAQNIQDLATLDTQLQESQPDLADILKTILSGPAGGGLQQLVGEIIAPVAANNIGPVADLRNTVNELTDSVTADENALIELNNALKEQERLAAANAFARKDIQAIITAQNLDADAIQNRIQTLTDETNAITDFIKSGKATEDILSDLSDRQRDIAIQVLELFNALPGAQAQQRIDDAKAALQSIGTGAVRIQEQTQQRIERIVEQGAKQIERAEERLSDARTKLVDYNTEVEDKRAKINGDFMKDDLERLDDFHKKEAKINRDANKEALRDLQDHRDKLLSAEIDNNVAAFLAEQQAFKKDQARKSEDEKVAASDRLDALETERQKARDVRDERIKALDEEAAKKRADLQAEIADRAAAIEEIKQGIEDQKQAQLDAQDEALRKLVESFDPAVNQMVQTVQAGFAILQNSGINATQSIATILDELQRRANTFYLPQSNASVQSYARKATNILRGRNTITAFAPGGLAPANQVVRVNDGGGMESGLNSRGQLALFSNPTRIFSASDTRRLLSGLSGGTTINFSMNNVNLGAMTREDFKGEMTPILQEMAQGMAGARYGRVA